MQNLGEKYFFNGKYNWLERVSDKFHQRGKRYILKRNLKPNNTIFGMKGTVNEFNRRSDTPEKSINVLENCSIQTIQNKAHRWEKN